MSDTDTMPAPDPLIHNYEEAMRDKVTKALAAINGLIEATTTAINAGLDTNDLVRVFNTSRMKAEAVGDTLSRFNKIVGELSAKTIPERFAAEKIKTIKLEDVGRISVSYRKSASIIPEKKMEAMDWFRTNDPDIITETINSSTLAAWVGSEYIEKNLDPPEFVKFSTSPYTSITKG